MFALHCILQILYAESLDTGLIIRTKNFFPWIYSLATVHPLRTDGQTDERINTRQPCHRRVHSATIKTNIFLSSIVFVIITSRSSSAWLSTSNRAVPALLPRQQRRLCFQICPSVCLSISVCLFLERYKKLLMKHLTGELSDLISMFIKIMFRVRIQKFNFHRHIQQRFKCSLQVMCYFILTTYIFA